MFNPIAVSLLLAATQGSPVTLEPSPPARHRLMVFAGADYGQGGDDEGSLSTGPALFGGLEVRLTRRFGLEGYLTRSSHERNFEFGQRFSGDQTFAGGSLVVHFGKAPVEGFVLAGLGALHSNHEARVPLFDEETGNPTGFATHDYSTSVEAWQLGGGADVRLPHGLILRPEVRFVIGASYLTRLSAGAALAWRF